MKVRSILAAAVAVVMIASIYGLAGASPGAGAKSSRVERAL
jgi:hypothetical protein